MTCKEDPQSRRDFISKTMAGAAVLTAWSVLPTQVFSTEGPAKTVSSILLPDLPWNKKALEPYLSERTIDFHYGKHHAAYVRNTIALIENTPYQNQPLPEIVQQSALKPNEKSIFNNAAQVWNHTFYWNSIKPGGGGKPEGKLAEALDAAFGSFTKFKEGFAAAAASQFGSGWAWLVLEGKNLKLMTTGNAETPLTTHQSPLVTIDVWEHAYYLDYQNDRAKYIQNFLEHLINWDFVTRNYTEALDNPHVHKH